MSSSDGNPIKRSEETRLARGTRMRAQARPADRAAGGGAAKVADESEKHQLAVRSASENAASSPPQPSKLVFGLNPRAHRSQAHSARTASVQRSELSDRSSTAAEPLKQASAGRNAKATDSQLPQPRPGEERAPAGSAASGNAVSPARKTGQVRASKYGNFYKPQDLTRSTKVQPTNSEQVAAQTSKLKMTKPTASANGSGESEPAKSAAASGRQSRDSATSSKATVGSATVKSRSVRSTSKSPDRSKQRARRKSFDEDISTVKIESAGPVQQPQQQRQQQAQQQKPVLKTRTQFNILPPPQLAIATTGKGSVVGYAKSRIYDRPVKQILANPPESTYSALDDRSGQIPVSILSGFKPPKQVNVTKAREKWEGGEPFAKCKSRKRLAAQANKKLFPGTWSMTSVVATQQLHLQQALAQSASSANHRSNPFETDPSVKVLTRGSVLERVQQFERAPTAKSGGGGGTPSGDPFDDLLEFDIKDLATDTSLSRSSSSSSSSGGSLGSDGGEAVQQQSDLGGSSKQAQYKSRVSSIQQQQQLSTSTNVIAAITTEGPSAPPAVARSSSTTAAPAQQRRLSLRRRSSLGRSSTSSLIPRFHHPNGKPNTYEIEIRKRDIVACFDKLPERRAQVSPNNPTSRKQFHQTALACGYSEYFKVPLQRFVAHKLATEPKIGQMAAGQPARQRKSSTVALNLNGTSPAPLVRPLVKAASVDSARPSESTAPTDEEKIALVSCEQFLACWRDLIGRAYDNAAQFIHLLTLGQRNWLAPDDFIPLVQSIIDDHPGLKFLRAAPDFHMRYIQTVIARIYFNVNRSWTGKITLQELRKSNLLAVLTVLGQEEDINQITDYFSYEHFYVIYCKFWSLDQDHDLFISKEDLARHNDAAISSRVIERIFSGIVSKQIQQTGRMSYSDFVWFLIAEEDKKHPRSIEYWFRLMDLDGDGYISMYEMEYFYYEQTKRLELMSIEALPFLDSACQILDLVNPKEKNKISLADLKRTKLATIFFDTFINLEKYLEHESREFVSTRDVVQGGVVISDWDRYASEEYESLVTEESTV